MVEEERSNLEVDIPASLLFVLSGYVICPYNSFAN